MKTFPHLTKILLSFSTMVAGGAFAFAVMLTFVVSFFRDVEISAWNVVASHVAPWFLLFVGVYAIHNVLPIAVAHGRTRREFLVAASGLSVALTVVATVLAWLGFLAEGAIYPLMDWNADDRGMLFAHPLMFLVWFVTGMFCAAAFARFGAGGAFALPVAFALMTVTRAQIPGTGTLPFVANVPDLLGPGWHAVSGAAFVVALAGTWAIARDMPIRIKT